MWWTRLTERILAPKLETLRGFRGWCVRAARVAYFSVRKLREDLGLERAATLSFVSILSLIPLGILFFSFADLVGVIQPIKEYVKENVVPLVAPDFKNQLASAVEDFFAKQESFREGTKGITGFVGILTLIPAALAVLVMAEKTLNVIWNVPTRRTYVQRFATFWVILTTSPFILIATTWVPDYLPDWLPVGPINHFLVQVSIGFVAFTVVYVYLPATSVKLRHAALGGVVAAALWQLSKASFTLYVGRADTLYGQMAIIPLALVWLYLNWLIVLVGCEVSYVAQNLAGMHPGRSAAVRPPLTLVGLAYIEAVVEAFMAGRCVPTTESFARERELDAERVAEAATRLSEAGLLVETVADSGFAPARDPETIRPDEVLDALLDSTDAFLIRGVKSAPDVEVAPQEDAAASFSGVRSVELLRRSGSAYRAAMKDVTLAELVAGHAESPASGGSSGAPPVRRG